MYTFKDRVFKICLIIFVGIILMLFESFNMNFDIVKEIKPSDTVIYETIETKVIELTSDTITIEFTNRDSVDWHYSQIYSFEVFTNNMWCVLPFYEKVSFDTIAYELAPQNTTTQTYSLKYHQLEPGLYRIIVNHSSTEFEIK